MLRTFNCGLGMIVIAVPAAADTVSNVLTREGEQVVRLGKIVNASGDAPRVIYTGHLDLS